ncbi:hypothetical protein KBW71_08075 [Hydrogenophaga aromaticivorans]|uniref:hypothetical protein n=1 Tax=Hydrogenophaga aromaticivorans TaxID=2610898 RepID=UPI001B360E3D|nr:hypothetical protein [Hydrogenophaga aromaticivorans]MBQ0918399.1 hypothetical protein [Hydrogenophaga aromaticivorans]
MALKSKDLGAVRSDLPTNEAVPQEELVRVNLEVTKSIRQAWKTAALERDMTLTDLIKEAMDAHLSK